LLPSRSRFPYYRVWATMNHQRAAPTSASKISADNVSCRAYEFLGENLNEL